MTEETLISANFEELSKDSILDEYIKKQLFQEEKIIKEEHEKKIKTIQKTSFIFGAIGTIFFLFSFGFYTLPKFFEFQKVKSEISATEKKIDQIELQKITYDHDLKELLIKENQLETTFGKIFPIILPEVKSSSEYQSALNRLAIFFEDFALFYNKGNSPLNLPSITFGNPIEKEDIFIVPIQMTVEASKENFNLFIEEINNRSGSLKEEDFYLSSLTKKKEPIPVMSIDSLNISLPKSENNALQLFSTSTKKPENNTLTFSISISAYFKSTDEMKALFGSKNKK